MGNNGWIKLHRKFLHWEWYDCPKVLKLFIHCLLKANHTKKEWRGNTIPRGTFVTSLPSLSNETGLSIQNIRTALDKLESTNEVNRRSTSVNTWLTVVNYDSYQSANKEVTDDQQTTNMQLTTTKNEKNVKNEEEYSFVEFWDLYDLKKAKQKAKKEWGKLSADDKEKIMENVPIFKTHFSSKQFTPRPRKYLHNRYWEDEGYQEKGDYADKARSLQDELEGMMIT